MRSLYGRFFQMGYVTRDIAAASERLLRRTGARRIDVIHDMRNEDGDQIVIRNLSHLRLPGLEIELIEPRLDWPSIYLDGLPDDPADSAFHHAGFLVPDNATWDAAIASFPAQDTPIVMAGATTKVRFAYVDTRRQAGHYSEIVQRLATGVA